jgi:hypothetical protein
MDEIIKFIKQQGGYATMKELKEANFRTEKLKNMYRITYWKK